MGKQGSCLKRFTDIVISIITIIITSPILLISALVIKIDSKGPVFFFHERTGLKGKPFKMIKFRGMIDNALLHGPGITQVNDPRITRVGKILRRTSIDELPQLFNVLKGEMSIIGPRPEITSITASYSKEHQKVFEFLPGITGISQINGRQTLTPEQRNKMEIEYYSNETFWKDLRIFFVTFWVIVTNKGNI
ncbi:MAG: sugar transferase [Ignavibacteriota bacterium]|jgi:lipopolysaccharide/colanic/teichoic acid biosynthesis glycosyltransferase|nr:sugar transferase [Ignavibacteriota bacterium]MBW7843573.1 sugar transferase [Ignavibacterium sp.]MCO6447693.1 sugar transferase [Ignavibacterium album]MCZ2267329.1 sugar transferase [Ignavibacteriales bacterium]MDX9711863.1 sugar transferase [Ignavibacteriaceae bacterium]